MRRFKYFIVDGSWLAFNKFIAGYGLEGFKEVIAMLRGYGRVIVCWDSNVPNHRTEIWQGYKAERSEKPYEYYQLLQGIKKWLYNEFIWQFEPLSYGEGDDVVATICELFRESLAIVSCDKDFLQLVDSKIGMIKIKQDRSYKIVTGSNIKQLTGFSGREWVQIQALAGDPVDGFPGIPGIGLIIAKRLISAYQDMVFDILAGDGDSVVKAFEIDNYKLLRYAKAIAEQKIHLKKMYDCARLYHVPVSNIKF